MDSFSEIFGGLKKGLKNIDIFKRHEESIKDYNFQEKCIAWKELVEENSYRDLNLVIVPLFQYLLTDLATDIYEDKITPFETKNEAINYAGAEVSKPFQGFGNIRAKWQVFPSIEGILSFQITPIGIKWRRIFRRDLTDIETKIRKIELEIIKAIKQNL